MIPPDENALRSFRTTRLIALCLLVGAPLAYLLVATLVVQRPLNPQAGNDLMFYILLVVAAVEPLFYPLVEKSATAEFRRKQVDPSDRAKLFLSLTIIKLSFVAAAYVYGLVIYLISFSFERLAWLYLIGAVWSVIMWPRRRQFEEFIARENEPL